MIADRYFQDTAGRWWFWADTPDDQSGPYKTRDEAQKAFLRWIMAESENNS